MTLTEKIIFGAVVVAVSIAGSYFLFFREASLPSFGNAAGLGNLLAEHYIPYISTNGGFNTNLPMLNGGGEQVGANGTNINRFNFGTCSLIGVNANITASTSVSYDCAVSGVQPGDAVFGMFATTSASTAGPGWEVTRSSASSTAGYLTFNITNGTGATAYPPASIASTTQYIVVH